MAATAASTGDGAFAAARRLETATMAAWPTLESIADGGWVARFSRGLTKRSNSLSVLDPADDADVERRLDTIARHYRGRGLPATARITPLTGPALRRALSRRGAPPFEPSLVLSAPAVSSAEDIAERLDPLSPRWLAARQRLAEVSEVQIATLRDMLARMSVPAVGLAIRSQTNEDAAVAIVLQDEKAALVCHVVVDAARRGQGLGKALMRAAANWAAERGASELFLQVLASNEPAVRLYSGLGFTERYRYEHVVFQ